MPLAVVHHPAYVAELPSGHRFPMAKFGRLAEVLVEDGIVAANGFQVPAPAPAGWLALAHDRRYVDQVLNGAVPETIAREIGFPMTESVARRARAATGGTVLTARLALEEGIACNTAGGSHHARQAQGAGFCVFNDAAVAAHVLLADREVRRILIFDLDAHQGDGTAEIFRDTPEVTTVSMHAEKNYPVRKIAGDIDRGLPDGIDDDQYLTELDQLLADVAAFGTPDIVFYNAGVDPHADDRLGRLALTDNGIAERDARVIDHFRSRGVPLACVIGGGYSVDIDALARRHAILHRTAARFV